MSSLKKINVIGGGLAGSEAAYQISKFGINVELYEMRPKIKTEVHKTEFLAELVCSNSFRSDDKEYNAVGLLHEELRMADSLIMKMADLNKVPAGSALAVDRDDFSKEVDKKIKSILIEIDESKKKINNKIFKLLNKKHFIFQKKEQSQISKKGNLKVFNYIFKPIKLNIKLT